MSDVIVGQHTKDYAKSAAIDQTIKCCVYVPKSNPHIDAAYDASEAISDQQSSIIFEHQI